MTNLLVCIIMSENNNKQYLVSYFYKRVAFLIVFFLVKEPALSVVVHTFLAKQETLFVKHMNQYINIYLHRECFETSFLFVVLL